MEQQIIQWQANADAATTMPAIQMIAIDIFAHNDATPEQISCARSVLTEITIAERRNSDPAGVITRFDVLKRSLKTR